MIKKQIVREINLEGLVFAEALQGEIFYCY